MQEYSLHIDHRLIEKFGEVGCEWSETIWEFNSWWEIDRHFRFFGAVYSQIIAQIQEEDLDMTQLISSMRKIKILPIQSSSGTRIKHEKWIMTGYEKWICCW